MTGAAGMARLVAAVAKLSEAQAASQGPRRPTLGVVVDPRARSLSVQLVGYADPVQCTQSDLFGLFPLAHNDIVLCVPVTRDSWHVLDRLDGAEPSLQIDLETIEAPLVIGGPGFVEDRNDTTQTKLQALRFSRAWPTGTTAHTWTFDDPFGDVPYVIPTIEGSAAGAEATRALVSTVDDSSVVLKVVNDSGGSVTASLVALAAGVG